MLAYLRHNCNEFLQFDSVAVIVADSQAVFTFSHEFYLIKHNICLENQNRKCGVLSLVLATVYKCEFVDGESTVALLDRRHALPYPVIGLK